MPIACDRVDPARTPRHALTPGEIVLAHIRRSTAAAAPSAPLPAPLRQDGTDHLPAQAGIEYGSVGGASKFTGVQTTLEGGVIRPPSAPPLAATMEAAPSAGPSVNVRVSVRSGTICVDRLMVLYLAAQTKGDPV